MGAPLAAQATRRLFMSGNEAVARGAWEAGVRVAAAYPVAATQPDLATVQHRLLMAQVLARLQHEGPLKASDFTDNRQRTGRLCCLAKNWQAKQQHAQRYPR